MKPIYFPFTYISNRLAHALHTCFGKTTVYQPSKQNVSKEVHQLTEQGVVDMRFLAKWGDKDEKKLSAILKEYAAWTNLHQGDRGIQLDFFKVMKNKIPFFDDTSASQIKADIKNISAVNSNQKEPDPVFQARIFLSIAQNFDRQNDKIAQDMASFENARKDLIKNLRVEEETTTAGQGYQYEFETGHLADYDHMIEERMAAWTLLVCNNQMKREDELSGVFVTSSQPTIDYVLEKTPETEKILSIDRVPTGENSPEKLTACSRNLMTYLKNAAESSLPLKCDPLSVFPADLALSDNVSLSIYLVPGISPFEYFSRFARIESVGNRTTTAGVKLKNTLTAHIGFSERSFRSKK
jgi:hypothetical protein